MKLLNNASIRTKLILLAGVAVAFALFMSSTGIIVNDIRMIRRTTIEQLEGQARMMEFNSDGVLAFADHEAASNLLRSMSLEPAVEVACLLDAKNEVFAAYTKREGAPLDLPAVLAEGAHSRDDGHIDIIGPVREDNGAGELIGTLYIRANTDNIAAHTAAQVKYIGLVSLASLLAAVTITAFLQRAISRPILELTEAAQIITREEDYSIRVTSESEDELGTLYDSFNRMLDALKSTHDQVANQAEQLATEVGVRKQAEADLMVAKDAAEAHNRAKSEFLANMSHEIRTPLTGILGFTDLLLAGGDDGDVAKRMEYLSTVQASGKHLLVLINDILDLSKIESGRLDFESEACHADRLVSDVVRVLQVKADEKSLDLVVRWETRIPEIIYTDAVRVRQAIMNIVGNSVKFTAKGKVEIVGRLVERQGTPQLQIEVTDTGIGIAADQIERIFDPFVQADNSVTRRFGGTGLGLAISRRIARGLGGDLVAASKLGVGTKLTLQFDVGDIAGIPLVTPATIENTRAVPGKGFKSKDMFPTIEVLLVEDGETNRKLIKLLLERAGAKVTTAENGEVGCTKAMQRRFDLILMDMQMPVLDGYSATRRLRDAGVKLPIIALTAHAMTADRDKCLAAGCTDYIAKPINTEQLFAAVARALSSPRSTEVESTQAADRRHAADVARAKAEANASPRRDIASSLPTDDREVAEIVIEYIDDLSAKLQEMVSAWDHGRLDELARLAHWLKGSGGTAGFDVFSQPAAHLENIVRGRTDGDVSAAIDELRSLHERLIEPVLV